MSSYAKRIPMDESMGRSSNNPLFSRIDAQQVVTPGAENVNNLVGIKVEPAQEYRVPGPAPVPWFNRNPMSQGILTPSGSNAGSGSSMRVNIQQRQGNNMQ